MNELIVVLLKEIALSNHCPFLNQFALTCKWSVFAFECSWWSLRCSSLTFGLLCCVVCRYSHRQRSYRHVPAEAHGLQREKPRIEEPQSSAFCSPGHLCLNRLWPWWAVLFSRAASSLVLLQADGGGLTRSHMRGLFRWQSALYFHSTFTLSFHVNWTS